MQTRKSRLRTERLKRARARLDNQESPGIASDYFFHLAELIDSLTKPICYVRVSKHHQIDDGTADNHETYLYRKLSAMGIRPRAIFVCQEKGWHLTAEARPELVAAAKMAKRRGAPLVALTSSRFIRSCGWTSQSRDARPLASDYEALLELAGGAVLATLLHPDASQREEHKLFSTLKGELTGDRGGRPTRPKDRRDSLLPQAQEMFAAGKSFRHIGKRLGVAPSTVQGWPLD